MNNDGFVSSVPILMTFIAFSCLIEGSRPAGKCGTEEVKIGRLSHLTEKTSMSQLECLRGVEFRLRAFPSTQSFVEVSDHKWMLNFAFLFFNSMEMLFSLFSCGEFLCNPLLFSYYPKLICKK